MKIKILILLFLTKSVFCVQEEEVIKLRQEVNSLEKQLKLQSEKEELIEKKQTLLKQLSAEVDSAELSFQKSLSEHNVLVNTFNAEARQLEKEYNALPATTTEEVQEIQAFKKKIDIHRKTWLKKIETKEKTLQKNYSTFQEKKMKYTKEQVWPY
jgi:septal ring factor EnvC (AmiA/AmiB activator)